MHTSNYPLMLRNNCVCRMWWCHRVVDLSGGKMASSSSLSSLIIVFLIIGSSLLKFRLQCVKVCSMWKSVTISSIRQRCVRTTLFAFCSLILIRQSKSGGFCKIMRENRVTKFVELQCWGISVSPCQERREGDGSTGNNTQTPPPNI